MYWYFSVFFAGMFYISDSVIQNNPYFTQKYSPFNNGKYWVEYWLIKSFERSTNVWIPTICVDSNLIVCITYIIFFEEMYWYINMYKIMYW